MFDNFKFDKEKLSKIIVAMIFATVIFLVISIFTGTQDSRQQITANTSTEETLCSILSDIKGVGDVDVMVEYDKDSNVSGVIVTASGAGNSVTKQNIIKAVSTLFNISSSEVVVYEKK